MAALEQKEFEAAARILASACDSGQVRAASLLVRHQAREFTRQFGACRSQHDVFLIASISKPMTVAAVMTLYASGEFKLDDPVMKFIPEFADDGRDHITIRHLLTHVSGLPDQLPKNVTLRKRHAQLSEFVGHAIRTPLLFRPGRQYSYSSMGILLAAEIAQRITDKPFPDFIKQTVFEPLEMKHSALGLGELRLDDLMQCQVEDAAPESGAGDPSAKEWDWNSHYWRSLGSPWGGVHSSVGDIAKFLGEFLQPGKLFKPQLAQLLVRNHNDPGLCPRGLGFAIGPQGTSSRCSDKAFGHGGSTGTLAWADPETDATCVVLTTLPIRAANPHPRQLVSDLIAQSVAKP